MADAQDIKIGVVLPGESLIVAIIEGLTVNRQTMSEENRNRFDKLLIDSWERSDKFWSLIAARFTRAIQESQ